MHPKSATRILTAGVLALSVVGMTIMAAPTQAAATDYSFHVSYRAYLSGLPVGKGHLEGEFDGQRYRFGSSGKVSGIARLFSSYEGTAEGRGRLPNGPFRLNARGSEDGDEERVRLRMDGGRVTNVRIDPPPEPHRENHPARIRLTNAHKRGVIDPMRAFVMTDGFDGRTFNQELCERALPVFSGDSRFDIVLNFREIRQVRSDRGGYSGPVMVCDARYRPVAGHRTDHSTVRYLRDNAAIGLMLAPLPDSGVLVPYRITVSTPLGPAVLQAETFSGSGRLAAFAGRAK